MNLSLLKHVFHLKEKINHFIYFLKTFLLGEILYLLMIIKNNTFYFLVNNYFYI